MRQRRLRIYSAITTCTFLSAHQKLTAREPRLAGACSLISLGGGSSTRAGGVGTPNFLNAVTSQAPPFSVPLPPRCVPALESPPAMPMGDFPRREGGCNHPSPAAGGSLDLAPFHAPSPTSTRGGKQSQVGKGFVRSSEYMPPGSGSWLGPICLAAASRGHHTWICPTTSISTAQRAWGDLLHQWQTRKRRSLVP